MTFTATRAEECRASGVRGNIRRGMVAHANMPRRTIFERKIVPVAPVGDIVVQRPDTPGTYFDKAIPACGIVPCTGTFTRRQQQAPRPGLSTFVRNRKFICHSDDGIDVEHRATDFILKNHQALLPEERRELSENVFVQVGPLSCGRFTPRPLFTR
ncbi:MAG: hypothetical protein HY056_05075 [Proteobacteria bacterium]|nr:hypothetical protein [Pseudomonadota bacterium]